MGRSDDPNAVVDSKANVIGVNGLRVVDASSFALLPPGHPMATVCKFFVLLETKLPLVNRAPDMLAEKIADDILKGR
jgi:hypothetical protein